MVFATNKEIVAVFINGHPVASAVEFFFTAGGKRIADKTGRAFFRSPVVALHHYGTSSVEKSLLAALRDFSAGRINGDQVSIGTSFPDRNGRRLVWCDRPHLVVCAYIRLRRSVKIRIF